MRRGLRIAGAIFLALVFAALTLGLLIFAVIYVIAIFDNDGDPGPLVFIAAAIVFLGLAALSGWITKLCALRAIRLLQS